MGSVTTSSLVDVTTDFIVLSDLYLHLFFVFSFQTEMDLLFGCFLVSAVFASCKGQGSMNIMLQRETSNSQRGNLKCEDDSLVNCEYYRSKGFCSILPFMQRSCR